MVNQPVSVSGLVLQSSGNGEKRSCVATTDGVFVGEFVPYVLAFRHVDPEMHGRRYGVGGASGTGRIDKEVGRAGDRLLLTGFATTRKEKDDERQHTTGP